MSLTSSMLVGFTGIQANSVAVDTVGNNLANVNTTAYKSQRTLFETLLYQTVSSGDAPSDTGGGTLPRQIGYGAGVASLQRNFGQGGFEGTGIPSDLAIDGEGFFILQQQNGDQVYTRDGTFNLDASQTLVSVHGVSVQTFGADADGNILPGTLTEMVIPIGSASQAIETSAVIMNGRLDSTTNVSSQGAVVVSQALLTAGGPAVSSTRLEELVDENGLLLFSAGDSLSIQGSKGGVAVEDSTFVVGTTGSTVGDLVSHLEAVMGIDTSVADVPAPGVSISDGTVFPAGSLVIRSNLGEINAVSLGNGSITNTTGAVTSPLAFASEAAAVGAGVTTSFIVFDSLGQTVDVRLRASLESKSETGTTWSFIVESIDDSDLSPIIGTGTITFDTNGQFVSATGTDLSIDRAGSGSAAPLSFRLDLSGMTGLASPDGESVMIMADQDGAPAGILVGYAIDRDGIVTGTYSNQQTEVFGQIALALFPNNEGLVAKADNTFTFGANSGTATLVAPQTAGAGFIRSGSLEQSNVEIAREFVNLITASTGVSSASRVVRVADELLQELLLLAR